MDIFPYGGIKGRVIECLLDRPREKVKVTAVAKQLHASKGHVSEVIKKLKEDGLIKDGVVNLGDPYVRSLRVTVNLSKIKESGIITAIKKLHVDSAGLYGSWANGTNTEGSDVDIWIKTGNRIRAIDIAGLSRHVGGSLHVEPQILVLDQEKLKRLKEDNPIFYFTLLFGSIILAGEGIGQNRGLY